MVEMPAPVGKPKLIGWLPIARALVPGYAIAGVVLVQHKLIIVCSTARKQYCAAARKWLLAITINLLGLGNSTIHCVHVTEHAHTIVAVRNNRRSFVAKDPVVRARIHPVQSQVFEHDGNMAQFIRHHPLFPGKIGRRQQVVRQPRRVAREI